MENLSDGFRPGASKPSRLSFAVVLTWPELPNAEFEVVQRIVRAASNIGALVWVVDNDGYPLRSNQDDLPCPKRRLTSDDCTFVLSLHFESPRLYDIPTYTALWNPPDFYVGFGYGRTVEQLASHTGVLSCRSDVADTHAANIYTGLGRPLLQPFPTLFHGVPRPYLEPNQSEASRLFYVGVNWERVTGEKGRHHDLLQQLDAEDLISIYGPEEILGVAPWRGFATYRGSIPFDGESVVARINEAGICLAFSSTAHQISGIMSNRLFEGLPAGAVVIANTHPFITKYFADVVHLVDDQGPVEEMVTQIRQLILRVRSDPQEARARARLGQQRLAKSFSLEESFTTLFATHEERLARTTREAIGSERHEVCVILDATGANTADVERLLVALAAQTSVTIDLFVLGAPGCLDRLQNKPGTAIRSTRLFEIELTVVKDGKTLRRSAASGPVFAQALACVQTPYFCTMQADDHCFSDHLATLAHKLAQTPSSSFACSGKLEERLDKKGVARRHFESLTFQHLEALAEAAYPRDAGRFLFRSTLIAKLPHPVFGLLDAFEYRVLTLWALLQGPLAQTNHASYLRMGDVTADRPAPFFSEVQQQEVIRDTVRGNWNWLSMVSTLRQLRPAVAATAKLPALTLERTYATRKDGDGLKMLKAGFSIPEESGVWVEGREATIAFEVADLDKPQRTEIVLSVLGRVAKADGAPQGVTVTVNGQVAGQIVIGTEPALFRIPVPPTVDLHSDVTVRLRLRHADQVVDEGGKLLDDRRLGLHLLTFSLQAASNQTAQPLAMGHAYLFGDGGDGMRFAAEGFSSPEAEVTRVHGPMATLIFAPEAGGDDLSLLLIGIGPQSCTISLDGSVLGRVAFAGELDQKLIPLPALQGGRPYRLTLDLRQDGMLAHSGGSIALHRFGLFRTPRQEPPSAGLTPRRLVRALGNRMRIKKGSL